MDLIFTNVDEFYEVPEIIAPLALADHNMVIWTSKITQPQKMSTKRVTVRPTKPSALESFRAFLASYNWNDVTCATSVDVKVEKFLIATTYMINEFFPPKLFGFIATSFYNK